MVLHTGPEGGTQTNVSGLTTAEMQGEAAKANMQGFEAETNENSEPMWIFEEGEYPRLYFAPKVPQDNTENPDDNTDVEPGSPETSITPTDTDSDDSTDTTESSTNPHPDWGEQETHSGITHYVSADGTTSVEISAENADSNGIIWLREESEGTAAWYGIDNSAGTFESGSRFYVQWLNTADHPETFADIDEEIRQQVEENRGWLFRIGVIAPDGTRYTTLSNPVKVYVQIGDDWDKDDLRAYYIQQGADENVEVTYVENLPYPEATGEFGVMTLNHFSPYFIYDADTEAAQSALKSAKTGDELTYTTISGLGLIMTLALGLMLNSRMHKKKSNE